MLCEPLPLQLVSKNHFIQFFWHGVDLPPSYSDNVHKYTVVFFRLPLRHLGIYRDHHPKLLFFCYDQYLFFKWRHCFFKSDIFRQTGPVSSMFSRHVEVKSSSGAVSRITNITTVSEALYMSWFNMHLNIGFVLMLLATNSAGPNFYTTNIHLGEHCFYKIIQLRFSIGNTYKQNGLI